MIIREVLLNDAEKLIHLIKRVEQQSTFMLMEAGERKTPSEQLQMQIEQMMHTNNSMIFVAEQENELLGYLMVIGGNVQKKQHSAYIVIGIDEQHTNKGIGTVLFNRLEEWARDHRIIRLELTVVTDNKAGIALYMKSGFEIEGTKRKSLIIDGQYFDEFYMVKILE